MATNPQIRSFSSNKIEVFNPVFEDAHFGPILNNQPSFYLFAGIVLGIDPVTGQYSAVNSNPGFVHKASALLAYSYLIPGPDILVEGDFIIIIGGEVYADRCLFINQADDLQTIPAGESDSLEIMLRDHGIIVRYGENITNNDMQPCGPEPPPG